MICPNKKSKEWKNLVAKLDGNTKEAYRIWAEDQKAAKGIPEFNMGQIDKLVTRLQRVLPGVSVVINSDLDVSGKVIREGERTARVEINPELLQGDTIIHEFGHVFIDLLGGLENPIIKAGIARLQGSTIEKEVREEYAEEPKQKQDKEILARAIGIEGSKIFSNEEKQSAFRRWLNGIFRKLKELIGIERNEARYLASKLLSEHVHESELKGVIEEEFYLQKAKGPNHQQLTEKERLVSKAKAIVKDKIAQLERKKITTDEDTSVSTELSLLEFKLEEYETEQALLAYVTKADGQLDYINLKFKEYALAYDTNKEVPELDTIKYLRDTAQGYDIALIEDIQRELADQDLTEVMNKITTSIRQLEESYKKLGDKYIKNVIKPDITIIRDIFKRRAELEFVKDENFKKLRGQERVDKLEEFTDKYLKENEQEIKDATEKYLDDFLDIVQKDISIWASFVQNPKDISNDIIQTVSLWIDEADFKTRMESIALVKEAESLYADYIAYFGKKNNPKEQWEPFLSKNSDGSLAPRIISNSRDIEGDLEKWKEIKQGKYKNTAVEDLYDFIVKTQNESDKKIPKTFRLGKKLSVVNKNFYERVADTGILKAIKEGTIDLFKLRKEDTGFGVIEETDAAAKKSLTDTIKVLVKGGQEKKLIPIHFRGEETIKDDERSFDVLSLIILEAHQANNYANKFTLTNKVEYVLDRVKEATVYDRGYKNLLKVDQYDEIQIKEGDSNVYKALQSLIENRIYDVKMTGDPTVNKVVASVRKYVSITNLFGNYLSGGSNLLQGLSMVFMEGAGGSFYGKRNVISAAGKYRKDSINIAADVGRRQDLSKTNLLVELFNANSADSILNEAFSKNNVFKRELSIGSGLIANSTAEHWAQSIGMYAVLDNIKVKNKDGKYINKKGEVVEDRKDAMSLDEAYSVGYQNKKTKKTISNDTYNGLSAKEKKNYFVGVLHLNEKVASTDRSDDLNLFKISSVIRRINRELFGNYDRENKSKFERTAVGSLVTHMRQWMLPGLYKRFRGHKTLWIRDKVENKKNILDFIPLRTIRNTELREHIDLHYNHETQSFEEGMYVSTLRYISGNLKNLLKLKLSIVAADWNNLTLMEKKNIHRTISEAALVVSCIIAQMILSGLAEDDDDDFVILLLTFYARRLQAELLTYVDPREWQRTFRSPAVSLNLLEGTVDALMQIVFDPTERYERGKHKDKNKAVVKLKKITPWKALFRDPKETLKWYQN